MNIGTEKDKKQIVITPEDLKFSSNKKFKKVKKKKKVKNDSFNYDMELNIKEKSIQHNYYDNMSLNHSNAYGID